MTNTRTICIEAPSVGVATRSPLRASDLTPIAGGYWARGAHSFSDMRRAAAAKSRRNRSAALWRSSSATVVHMRNDGDGFVIAKNKSKNSFEATVLTFAAEA